MARLKTDSNPQNTIKTMAGTASRHEPQKTIDREVLVEFLRAAGIDANKTVVLHADPHFITAEHTDGSRTIVQIR